jgi:hypothetical protein
MAFFRDMNRLEVATVGSAILMTIAPLVPYAIYGA